MDRKIIVIGDDNSEVLRRIAKEVQPDEIEAVQPLIDEMIDVARDTGALGLAAPQLGESKRIFVLTPPDSEPIVCINPGTLMGSGKVTSYEEGCMSVPGKRYDIKRIRRVILRCLDRNGTPQTLRPQKKILNIAIQHELDHLRGVLVCDKGKEI